jgi:hypothetical protein
MEDNLKNYFHLILWVLSFILSPLKGNEDDPDDNDDVDDLGKSLDDNLEKMSQILKSKPDSELRELLSDPKTRSKLKGLLKSDDDEDDDDEEDESYMKKGKKKMKKSKKNIDADFNKSQDDFDDAVSKNAELIDAVPVVGDLVKCMQSMIKSVNALSIQASESIEKSERMVALTESMAAVIGDQSEMIKSTNELVEELADEPGYIPGNAGQASVHKGQIMRKSGHSPEGSEKGNAILKSVSSQPVGILKSVLLAGFKEGKVTSNSLSKFEMSNGDIKYLNADEIAYVHSKTTGGNS